MIHIVALFKVRDAQAFQEFETAAGKIMRDHGGSMVSAFGPDRRLSSAMDIDEVHYLQFPNLDAFNRYREDKRLATLSELRSKAIADTRILISGKTKNYSPLE